MGRSAARPPRPEDADSWGEFRARLDWAADSPGSWMIPVWWVVGAILFMTGMISVGYALTDRHWWLWVSTVLSLAIVGVMAVRGVDQADRARERAAELARLEDAWFEHLARHTGPGRPPRNDRE